MSALSDSDYREIMLHLDLDYWYNGNVLRSVLSKDSVIQDSPSTNNDYESSVHTWIPVAPRDCEPCGEINETL